MNWALSKIDVLNTGELEIDKAVCMCVDDYLLLLGTLSNIHAILDDVCDTCWCGITSEKGYM